MRVLAPPALLGAVVLFVVHEWKGLSYWNYSEGVYAFSARATLDGADAYSELVFAQPPGVLVAGVGLLAIDDGLEWLRLAVGGAQLVAALIAALAVHRLTGSRLAAALTAPAGLLMPWAVHEHGHLTPETVALPLLLGGAVLAARPGRASAAAGVLLSLAVLTKLPFALPAAAVLLVAADRRTALTWAAGSFAALTALAAALFGEDLWRGAVQAQMETGGQFDKLAGVVAQAGWNLLGLLVLAAGALVLRKRARDPALLLTLSALAAGTLLTLTTLYKHGTALNVVVPVEAALLPLAATGLVWALALPRWRVAAPVAAAFAVAQGVGLMVGDGPFLRPFSAPAYGHELSEEEVERAVAEARRCPPDTRHNGPPFTAFLARRPMVAGQPDQFIIAKSEVHADVLERAKTETALCPSKPAY